MATFCEGPVLGHLTLLSAHQANVLAKHKAIVPFPRAAKAPVKRGYGFVYRIIQFRCYNFFNILFLFHYDWWRAAKPSTRSQQSTHQRLEPQAAEGHFGPPSLHPEPSPHANWFLGMVARPHKQEVPNGMDGMGQELLRAWLPHLWRD